MHVLVECWNTRGIVLHPTQGLLKFDPSLGNPRESSTAPESNANVEPGVSADAQHSGSTFTPSSQIGQKLHQSKQQSIHQVLARTKPQDTDKRPKKRAKKSEDAGAHANWDSDQSSQV